MAYIEKNDYFDYVIIGAGIGGLMFAYQMNENNPNAKILVIEKGDVLFNRKCPINEGKVNKCINCNGIVKNDNLNYVSIVKKKR